ncbi:MAG: hypothetical protein WDZ39_01440 [Candidatus Spechtbacterales bacterium]
MIQEFLPRPPVPGEVWRFDYLEAHCFYMALDVMKEFADEDDPHFVRWLTTFKPIQDEMSLKDVRKSDPLGVKVTPLDEDVGFFTALAAGQRWHLGCMPSERELPCGHLPIEHDTIIKGWMEREITEARKFAVTRLALQSLPPQERIMGKPKLARSDMERLVDEVIETEKHRVLQSDGRLFSHPGTGGFDDQQLLDELTDFDIMGEHVYTEEQARDKISHMNESRIKERRKQLIKLREDKFDILEE